MKIGRYILGIKNRGLKWIKHPYYVFRFGKFGKQSEIRRPTRLLNTQNMYIGNGVSILNSGRLECISRWGVGGSICYNPKLIINDNTSIEQNCHIIAADKLEIGSNCVISAYVYISDCSHQYSDERPIMEQPLTIKQTKIGNSVFIGIGAKIMPGVLVGDYAVIGANAVVTHNVPDYAIAAGIPAKIIGWNKNQRNEEME